MNRDQPRTYLYKLTSDQGGAPCAPAPASDAEKLLSLAICKPALRRTARAGDRIIGISGKILAKQGYTLGSVIYAAYVEQNLDARIYYAQNGPYVSRPDCIYEFDQDGRAVHRGLSTLHEEVANLARDIGVYSTYKNSRVLLARDFRYFGQGAKPIPEKLHRLHSLAISESLTQGHRRFDHGTPEQMEAEKLFQYLWKFKTSHTPDVVAGDSYDHARKPEGKVCPTGGTRKVKAIQRCPC